MLSKVMSLKASKKEEIVLKSPPAETKPQPITVKIETKPGEEAVG
jgi:hypothetical protein